MVASMTERSNVIPFPPRKRAEPTDPPSGPQTNDGLSARARAIREAFGYPIDPPDFENKPRSA